MSGNDVICNRCGATARLVRLEGEVFHVPSNGKPPLFQIIECPRCGQREQLESHEMQGGTAGAIVS